jgi:hypothetical protein
MVHETSDTTVHCIELTLIDIQLVLSGLRYDRSLHVLL